MIMYSVSGESKPDQKILQGLERIGEIFRILAWKESGNYHINPTQLGLLFLISNRNSITIKEIEKITSLDKTTLSKSLTSLAKRKLIKKKIDSQDKRNKPIVLTLSGNKLLLKLQKRFQIFEEFLISYDNKQIIYKFIFDFINFSLRKNIIQSQRMCFQCKFFENKENGFYCNYLKSPLTISDLQIDCREFQKVK